MAMLERIHLTILKSVDEQGSLTAAAKQLHVTQSALSHTMRKLEDQLATKVWLREGRQLRLTEAGQYLLDTANRLLPQFSDAEEKLLQIAAGERGTLRIGMECHPCYQWLLKIASPFLQAWPDVDMDVKQKFQFGGVGALLNYEIDMLVTPDPYQHKDLNFKPVFDYEQVLVVPASHALAKTDFIEAQALSDQILLTYPVAIERLDIYKQFLHFAGVTPKQHKTIETTDIMLQMVASGRGVAALPRWLAEEYKSKLAIQAVRLGEQGVAKQIHLGIRNCDARVNYLQAFIDLAKDFSVTAVP